MTENQEPRALSPAELAYMRVWAAMPEEPSEIATAHLRAIALELGVQP